MRKNKQQTPTPRLQTQTRKPGRPSRVAPSEFTMDTQEQRKYGRPKRVTSIGVYMEQQGKRKHERPPRLAPSKVTTAIQEDINHTK